MWSLAFLSILALVLASCGGGVGTGGTGSDRPAVARGPITGFGSVIVAGVRWDDSTATVLDEDGAPLTRDGNELRLGMTVEIEGSNGVAPQARTIRVDSAVVGPLASVDAASRTLTVLGQDVRIGAGTVFDEALPQGLSSLQPGQMVTVYGLPEASGAGQVATRIEPAPQQAVGRVRGVVSGLDMSARTLRIGNLTLGFDDVDTVPAGLANGAVVRVTVRPAASGRWNVAAFGRPDVPPQEGVLVEVDGLVSGYEGLQQFVVGALTVDAREATIRPAGAELANGLRVEVRGVMSGGVLVAGRVQVRGEGSGNDDGGGNGGGGGGGSGSGGGNGNGSGSGSGSGSGNGNGNGNGSGSGSGSGDGNGSGNESGSGTGTGNGNAPGNGAGNSNGTGNNNGNGNGNGSNNGNANASNGDRVYRVNGRISDVDGPQGTFVIRKTLLDYQNAAFHGGTPADLAAGTMVQAEGTLSSDGTRLLATSVEFR